MGNKSAKESKSSNSKKLSKSSLKEKNKPDTKPSVLPTKNSDIGEADYQYLTSQTGLSKSEIKEIFDLFMRNNPNAQLDKNEFIKLYSSLRPENPENLDEISAFIFRAFDTDHNGYITFNEFMLGFALTSRGDIKKKLEYAFMLYDADQNGYLDNNEIKEVIIGMLDLLGADKNTHNPQELANEVMRQLDSSNDGKVSKDEFINGLMKNFALRSLLSPFS